MSIEIRELHIIAVVDGGGEKKLNEPGEAAIKQGGEGGGESPDQLIDLCVEKVLEIIKQKTER